MNNELPQGWSKAQIDELCEVSKDKGQEGILPYLEIGNVNIDSKEYIFTDKPSVKGCKIAKKNDVLVSRVRPTRGAIVEVREKELQVSSAFTILQSKGFLVEKYLWFYLAWNRKYLNYLGDNCTGTMYPTTSKDVVVGFEIPVAPLNEQKKIIHKLERLLGETKNIKKRLEKIPSILKRFRQSVLAAACSGRLTSDWREMNPNVELDVKSLGQRQESLVITDTTDSYDEYDLPLTWRWLRIKDVGDVKGGKRVPKGAKLIKDNTGLPYIKAGNLKGGTVLLDKLEYLTPDVQDKIKRYIVSAGDLYLTNVGACIGDAGIVPDCLDGANLTENAVKICQLGGIRNQYLSMWLRSPECQEFIRLTVLSAAQGKLALGRVKMLPVPLPPFPEQDEIVLRVNELFALADQIETRYSKAKVQVDKLTQSILAKAFRGELVEQDPNDEPASMLMERIKSKKK